ncbi:MAG: hypothetical protein WC494_02080 [Candidatus Pacearchaeota archaeon]
MAGRRKNLSPEEVDALRRNYDAGLSHREASESLDIRPSTVHSYFLAWRAGLDTPYQYLDRIAERNGVGSHRVYTFLKKEAPRKRRLPLDYEPQYQKGLPIEEREELSICLKALHKVNPYYLTIVYKRIWDGQSFVEIGRDLKKSPQLVHFKYHEAIRHLKRIYTIRNPED